MKKILTILPILILIGAAFSPGEARGSDGVVGPDVCKGCHEDKYASYAASVHGRKAVPGSPANRDACESCHGPGGAHAEKGGERGAGILIFGKQIQDPQTKSARCLACHAETRELTFWDMGRHKTMGVSCNSCHTVHSTARKLMRGPQPDLCNSCHRVIRLEQNKQSHHPIREGKIKCTDCHEPHGSIGPRQIKADSVNELCYRCHTEKRGPFMWEHPPVEENCLNCHVPHGSNRTKLLFSRPPHLCQACHDVQRHPGTQVTAFETFRGANPSNKMFARACLNCHSNIHGSNGPANRGKRFVR